MVHCSKAFSSCFKLGCLFFLKSFKIQSDLLWCLSYFMNNIKHPQVKKTKQNKKTILTFRKGAKPLQMYFTLQREPKWQPVLQIKHILNQLFHLLFSPVINDECHHKKCTKGTLRETVLIVLLWQQSQCCFWPMIICLWSFFFFYCHLTPGIWSAVMEALPLCQEFSGAINKDSLMSYQRHKPLSVCVCVSVRVCVESQVGIE